MQVQSTEQLEILGHTGFVEVAALSICARDIAQVRVAVLSCPKTCPHLLTTPFHTINGLDTVPGIIFVVE